MSVTQLKINNWNKPKADCDGVGSQELLAAIPGITYRQIHYWTATRRLQCHLHLSDGTTIPYHDGNSTGYQACYPSDQVQVAVRMFRLINLGVGVIAAHKVATDLRVANELFDELGWITRDLWLAAPQPVEDPVEGAL